MTRNTNRLSLIAKQNAVCVVQGSTLSTGRSGSIYDMDDSYFSQLEQISLDEALTGKQEYDRLEDAVSIGERTVLGYAIRHKAQL